jgi:hypothetical protein
MEGWLCVGRWGSPAVHACLLCTLRHATRSNPPGELCAPPSSCLTCTTAAAAQAAPALPKPPPPRLYIMRTPPPPTCTTAAAAQAANTALCPASTPCCGASTLSPPGIFCSSTACWLGAGR